MITDAILTVLTNVATFILDLLPDQGLPSAVTGGSIASYAATVQGWVAPVAYWVPMGLAFQIAYAVLVFVVATRAFNLVVFLRKTILP